MDDATFSVALPFTFNFNGTAYTQAFISENGYISFGSTDPGTTTRSAISSTTANIEVAAGFSRDLGGVSASSNLRSQVLGSAPNRTYVIQWTAVANYLGSQSYNFQIILSEANGVASNQTVQIVYGTMTAASATTGQVGLRGLTNANYNNRTTTTNWAATTAGVTNADAVTVSPTVLPVSGATFTFTPPVPCVGTPTPGTPSATTFNACIGSTATIAVTGSSSGVSGLTYQWEKSADGTSGWTNVGAGTGATTTSYTTAGYSGIDSFYRMRVTCTPSSSSAVTVAVKLTGPATPVTQASNITFSGQTLTGLTVNWTNGSGNDRVVFMNSINTFTDPISPALPGTAATAWANAGQQLIYDGTATSVSVTALTSGTTYYFKVYETQKCTGAPNTYYYNAAAGTNNPLSGGPLTSLAYEITRSTGISYTSIAATGTNFTSWSSASSGDDNTSVTTPIGFNFTYMGQAVSSFKVCTNGWISLAPVTTTSTAYQNNLSGGNSASLQAVVAPFWDDLVVTGQAYANINNIKYLLSGTAPNRVLTVEWIGMETYNNPGPNLNFQVKLYETSNNIEFVYGTMTGFDGTSNYGYSYSVGMNSFSTSATLSTGEILAQQNFNTKIFAETNAVTTAVGANGLTVVPECNSKLLFTPGTYTAGSTIPAITNDEPAGAITLPVGVSVPTDFCGLYTSSGATASAGIATCNAGTPGTADDDVWFKFTIGSTSSTNITVRGSGGYDPVLQLFSDAGITSVACINANGSGLAENISQSLSAGTYYLRVYHSGTGSGTTPVNGTTTLTSAGYFYIGVYATPTPPVNDDPCGAVNLTVANTCTNYTDNTVTSTTSILSSTTTTSNGIAAPTCAGAGTSVNDVWFKFTATSANALISVTPVAGFDAAFQVDSIVSGTCGGNNLVLNPIVCVNAGTTGAVETTIFSNLVVGHIYYIRVYRHPSGTTGSPVSNSQFSVCVQVPIPVCTTNSSPANATTGVAIPAPLSWTSATYATSYDVYIGTTNPPVTLAGNSTTTSYNAASLLSSTLYYWYVVPKNADGSATGCSSSVTSFTTAAPPPIPSCTTNSSPASAATNIALAPTLSWASATNATNYDVYLGTTNPPTTLVGNSVTSSYSASGLTGNTLYYWYVVPKNITGSATGCSSNTTSFTTVPPPPANDNCATAIAIVQQAYSATPTFTVVNTSSATQSTNTSGCFSTSNDDDVWYSFVATATSVVLKVDSWADITGTSTFYWGVYSGTCASTTEVNCALGGTTNGETTVTGLTIGNTYFARVMTSSTGNAASFNFAVLQPAIVPVTFTSFKGEKVGSVNKLSWTTASEVNNTGFELQRSADGVNFNVLSFVASKASNGNSTQSLSYSFDDVRPLLSTGYYRLKQIDKDGKFNYSAVVTIKAGKAGDLIVGSIYPNPVVNNASLTISSTKHTTVDIVVLNTLGMRVAKQTTALSLGDNVQTIDASKLSKGLYYVQIITADGTSVNAGKFVKD
jgi:hypothetical protein